MGGNLEYGRAADTLVGEEQVFFKAGAIARDTTRDRKSSQTLAEFQSRPLKRKGDQPGSHRCDLKPKLPSDFLGKAGRSHLGNGRTSGGHDQRVGDYCPQVGTNQESVLAIYAGDFALESNGYPGCFAFCQQHADDFPGGAVTEELTQLLLVIRDVVLFHQVYEVLRCVPSQGGDASFPFLVWGAIPRSSCPHLPPL